MVRAESKRNDPVKDPWNEASDAKPTGLANRRVDTQVTAADVTQAFVRTPGPYRSATVLTNLGDLLPDLESAYKDIHAHPELSMQEKRTAGIAADLLRAAGYEVTTGVG